jgi:hypothetical protein
MAGTETATAHALLSSKLCYIFGMGQRLGTVL